MVGGALEQPLEGPVVVEQLLGDANQRIARRIRDDALSPGCGQGLADVDHGLGQREVAGLGRPMDHRDLVIVLEIAVAIRFENATGAIHAERVQLGGAQRAHAGAAEHVDALGHRPQNLLVPDREHALEVPVDDADRARPLLRHAIDIALGDGRQDDDFVIRRKILLAQRGANEHAGLHGCMSRIARTRRPAT